MMQFHFSKPNTNHKNDNGLKSAVLVYLQICNIFSSFFYAEKAQNK